MKSRMLYLALLICMALSMIIDTGRAQNRRVGTSSATELLIPVGGRDLAMGGGTIAGSEGIESIYWNPAGLGRLGHSAEAMFSQMAYIADIGVSYAAVAGKFKDFGVLGLTVKSLDIGKISETTQSDPEGDGGKFFSPTYFTLGISYARQLTDAIGTGVTVKIISETIGRVGASNVAFDVGVQYRGLAGVSGLQLGVAVKNIGPQMRFGGSGLLHEAIVTEGSRPAQQFQSVAASFELPSVVEVGLGYSTLASDNDNMMWSVAGSFTNNSLYNDEYHLGGEVGYAMESLKLFGRMGVGLQSLNTATEDIFGSSYGFGLVYAASGMDITVDYARRSAIYFDANQVISIKLGF